MYQGERPVKRLAAPLLRALFCALAAALLAACATPPVPAPPPDPLFHDSLFKAPARPIDAADVFALSEPMKHYLRVDIARRLRNEGLQRGLINALYTHGELKLDYDSAITRNAAEAFDARSGNCLSLLIMTAAFAKELGLHVTYQSVEMDETWSRSDDLAFSNGHVNLVLAGRMGRLSPGFDETKLLTIDFLPAEDILGQRTRPISEDTVIAMYMNNRAAEALARGELDAAYAWARAALVSAPSFSSAHNTLGVIYLRHGNLREAQAVLEPLLQREPQNRQALSNLAMVDERLGQGEAAQALRARLARIEPDPPYAFFRSGLAAMRRGDYLSARALFAREIARADYNSEFHFWFAIANLKLGDVEQARKHLAIAMDNSTTRGDHDLYAAKLDRLRALQTQ